MSKRNKKVSKRKKGSSTDEEENLNKSKCKVVRGPESGPDQNDSIVSVSNILSEANSILYEDTSVFDDTSDKSVIMATNTATVDDAPTNTDLFRMLKSISDRLTNMENKLDTLSVLEKKVDNFEHEVNKIWCKLDDFSKQFADRVNTCESRIDNIEFNDVSQRSEIEHLTRQATGIQDELTYLKSQSMRNNLIFGGIEEPINERQPDIEPKVRNFMVEKLKIAQQIVDNIVIERAHRTGYQESDPSKRRNRIIVCKFANFKDREQVRKQGFCLKNTNFFIKEQFPPEIAEKRRKLIPQLKAARDEGKRAWLAYDTLYIDGKPQQR
jgi:hypothetical protein